jgi:GTP-sensing pleiotropic transcriptional regulator CodY
MSQKNKSIKLQIVNYIRKQFDKKATVILPSSQIFDRNRICFVCKKSHIFYRSLDDIKQKKWCNKCIRASDRQIQKLDESNIQIFQNYDKIQKKRTQYFTNIIQTLSPILGGVFNIVSKILDTVNNKIDNDTEVEKLKIKFMMQHSQSDAEFDKLDKEIKKITNNPNINKSEDEILDEIPYDNQFGDDSDILEEQYGEYDSETEIYGEESEIYSEESDEDSYITD